MKNPVEKLVERLNTARDKGVRFQEEFEHTMAEIGAIRLQKVIAYSEKRYEITDPETNRWLAYSDVLRKFIRLEQLMKTGTAEELLDNYRDLASYSIMACQILGRNKIK